MVSSKNQYYDDVIMKSCMTSHVMSYKMVVSSNIEIDNDERGVICDFATISDIRITKAKPE